MPHQSEKVTVIIPVLNEERYIGELLTDLSHQTYKPKEIIVVDGKSTDKTLQILKQFKNIKIISSERSPARQRHGGAEKGTGDVFIFLDADVRFEKNSIEKMVHHLKRKNLDIACPFYLPYPFSISIQSIYIFFNFMFFLFQKLIPSGAGSCIIVTKKLYKQSRGFELELTYDDIQFIRKASRVGRFGMIPMAVKVSDRRFRKYGVIKTFLTYLFLSIFFIFNQFKSANIIRYTFGNYGKK